MWQIDPDVTYLNHGSFGAVPLPVAEFRSTLLAEIERNPVRFLANDLEVRLDSARRKLASFVGADPAGLVFVDNATTGVNTALRHLGRSIGPGDEIMVTDHEYNACVNAARAIARDTGADVVTTPVPFPVGSASEVVDAVTSALTERTRILLIDHVTSATALVLPIEEIVAAANARGVEVIVDGAHAPGMIPLNLADLDVAFYTGNGHKWMCAPKGAAFLSVAPRHRESMEPMVISHGWNDERAGRSRLHKLFDWTGTGDFTPFLSVPAAIDAMATARPGGWPEVMGSNRELALRARATVCSRLGVDLPAPDGMIGSMAAIPLPDGSGGVAGVVDPLTAVLSEEYRIEAPVFAWPGPGTRMLRISAQIYNSLDQYERLADALGELLAGQSESRSSSSSP